MKRDKRKRIFICTGLLLIAAALAIAGYNLWSDFRAGRASGYSLERLRPLIEAAKGKTEEQAEDAPEKTPAGPEKEPAGRNVSELPDELPDELPIELPAERSAEPPAGLPVMTVDGYDYIAVLEIPALGLELPVMSEWDYERLRTAPCRYYGSADQDDLVIVAHNYASHFGRLSSLHEGDEVLLTDPDGTVHRYRVAAVDILDPSEIEKVTAGSCPLTLITCTVSGEARVSVFCEAADR